MKARCSASFADVATLSARCRFRDCAHGGEPGCAVRAGARPDRLDNFQKMLRENRRDSLDLGRAAPAAFGVEVARPGSARPDASEARRR